MIKKEKKIEKSKKKRILCINMLTRMEKFGTKFFDYHPTAFYRVKKKKLVRVNNNESNNKYIFRGFQNICLH